ncbi:hypothetical protein [Tumebacillus flagellatus]|uniref:Tetratricopeptide repeat protein n=1 Tax=Tumebacillus flagellatus TaxID=1157490 RepID=A0A074LTB1_9BACL|nr:hypothetical protein [Tumebacillus flagellatus]KEO84264.1 hypothetical protein EL26_05725 [Tumebacillus flagellatus]
MSQMVLPRNVNEFIGMESGAHLLMMMLENALGHSLHRINPVDRANVAHEYGQDLTVELDLEELLNHLSLIRVVANLNSRAEESLIHYWAAEEGAVFLADARRYVADALRIAPQEHPERGRAFKNFAYLLLARDKPKPACAFIEKAMKIFQANGLLEPIEELLEMLSSRMEQECKVMHARVAAVLDRGVK